MCVVSNVGDFYGQRWPTIYPNVLPNINTETVIVRTEVTRDEFDALKAEVEQCKRLLVAAKEIDAALGEPDCEMEEKVALLRRFAEFVGIDLEDVLATEA